MASLMDRYFSTYDKSQGPLESAITPKKIQDSIAAILQYQQLKSLQQNIPEGMGNTPITSFPQLMDLEQLKLSKQRQADNLLARQEMFMQQPGIENTRLINAAMANPEFKEALMKARPDMFAVPSPTGIYDEQSILGLPVVKNSAKDFIKNIKEAQKAQAKKDAVSPFKLKKEEEDYKKSVALRKKAEAEAALYGDIPTPGTVISDKVANFKF